VLGRNYCGRNQKKKLCTPISAEKLSWCIVLSSTFSSSCFSTSFLATYTWNCLATLVFWAATGGQESFFLPPSTLSPFPQLWFCLTFSKTLKKGPVLGTSRNLSATDLGVANHQLPFLYLSSFATCKHVSQALSLSAFFICFEKLDGKHFQYNTKQQTQEATSKLKNPTRRISYTT